jgi:Uma2 family endonuclease
MHNLAQIPYISPEDYLSIERGSPIRHEYINGVMYAMAGGSLRHNEITVNITTLLKTHLRGRDCKTYNSDLRVLNKESGAYFYPDVLVICGKPILTDLHKDTVVNPLIIVEVLSPSTEAFDRDAKFEHYKLLDSFQVYVLISQDQPLVQKYTRNAEGWQLTEYAGLDSVLSLEAIEFFAPLRDIYEEIVFDEPPRTAPRLVNLSEKSE